MVKLPDGRTEVFRLYYVDCIETIVTTDSDKRRLRDQGRYFGVSNFRKVIEFGREGTRFREKALSKPFTVTTSFAKALGRSSKPRYYAFVSTSENHDLARELVENGLARNFGVRRETPTGIHRDDYEDFLSDVEFVAAIRKKGVWSESSPESIIEMRERHRKELRELEDLEESLNPPPLTEPISINEGSLEELERAGFRAHQARNVLEHREVKPIQNFADLDSVDQIGEKTIHKVKDNIFFDAEASSIPTMRVPAP
ncbi:MAG: helix-hairpin-helix domain-containing protein [Verrucomicrobiales bacterium]|nr:helix-hairpin-helix domain-containing protein [Verrucomicrobiales bacterium]